MQVNPAIAGRIQRIAAGNLGSAKLSGDGSTVVFSQWTDDSQWEVMRYRDGQVENISNYEGHDLEPAISDDGDTVVWSRFSTPKFSDPNGSWDIWRWKAGQEPERVTEAPGHETEAAISGDGQVISYTYDDPKSRIGFDIHLIRDGQVEEVTDGFPVDRYSKLNQDGSRVFWDRRDLESRDIWMRDEAGLTKPLTRTAMREWEPVVDSTGTVLAFSTEERGDHDLFLYSTEGHQRTPVAQARRVEERQADLSTGGETVVFAAERQIMLHENSETLQVTMDGIADHPQTSDDGRVLAWQAYEGNEAVLYLFERD